MERVAVVGSGSWGTALATVLAQKVKVNMWSLDSQVVDEINNCKTNKNYLPDLIIPENIEASTDLERTVTNSDVVVMSVPSQAFRENIKKVLPHLKKDAIIVNTSKGIEESSLSRISEVFHQEAPEELHKNFVVLSGPSHAEEVSKGIPTTVVAAGKNRIICEQIQDLFMSPFFRVYTNPDVVGVEMGGALKNVIAICTGISDGLEFGDNTKAAIMTRGLAEIARLGVAMGANHLTFAGLAGVGDLIVTCTSMHSRNRRFGIEVGKGSTVEDALKHVRMVVEGYKTAMAAYRLSQKYHVEMPITEQAYNVLYQGQNPLEAVSNLMMRGKKHESEEVAKSVQY